MLNNAIAVISWVLGRAPWVFALLPAFVVIEHAAFLWFTQPRLKKRDSPEVGHVPMQKALDATLESIQANFGVQSLVLRYFVPALLIAFTAVSVLNMLFVAERTIAFRVEVLYASRLGAMGSYFWVLLYLSRRSIRHDLTSGGAMVCAITVVLGPVLSGVLGHLLGGAPSSTGQKQTVWGEQALFFAAGLAPRRFAEALLDAVRRLWAPEQAATPPPARLTPLSQVRGITIDIEERLSEEGIYDAATLAMADPLRLFRNSSFELRQILWWMDEALLILFLPKAWTALQENGITGAIDFAWCTQIIVKQPNVFDDLARGTNIQPHVLRQVAERMFEDAQVQIVWVLYQTGLNVDSKKSATRTDDTRTG
jgi:hypothetical protein